ncbi:hypothetical protein IAQ61_011469 [Plenodomus lingam]|uniref:Uncharacterized protein n=1 Tax=Leptosphaeria maculans (strain JN3 / isolate v23.1.3 / race Av1-4-5-6-7-8) TaxID=985895 RepID=E5AA60_LEPMJ|nr:hypothetical protein LEMA_P016810.1 [Plenodomus lingam JN3]KAH9859688.1 hypothetical protein IAQ61_011469 [Plenodomus lingam]CBY00551.1 hypothetical protein LEMA_P016810.1 [Plenodomus lingam JN3]
MKCPHAFYANISIPPTAYGRMVTGRITCARSRHTLEVSPKDEQAEARIENYRIAMLGVLQKSAVDYSKPGEEGQATQLVQNFIMLATTLANSKALAFPLKIKGAIEIPNYADSPLANDENCRGTEDSRETAGSDSDVEKSDSDRYRYEKLHDSWEQDNPMSMLDYETKGTQRTVPQQLLESITHPLSIALIAYHFGGPVNAAHSARKHFWRCFPGTVATVPEFHVEGGTDEVLNEIRVTAVWEEQDQRVIRPSGKHNVFLSGDATPSPLGFSIPKDVKDLDSPLNIIYDHRDATLYYDCQDPNVVRNSVSLDFHLNTLTADILQLLSAEIDEQDIEKLTLTTLITEFPIVNYTAHFQRLLYSTDAMTTIIQKLASLQVPIAPPTCDRSQHEMLARFKAYNKDNGLRIPLSISSMPSDIPLTGRYASPTSFLDSVSLKAQRDIRRPIGHDLFPQRAMDQKRESARKLIRDLPAELVSSQLANYANSLVLTSYNGNDLLTTCRIRALATNMEMRCHELVALGFVDHNVDMSSMAALASALGAAMDGLKEIHVSPEPWVEEADLLMYRTRCLYLFWCIDWFVCYLVRPTEGSFMLLDAQKLSRHLNRVRGEMIQTAHLLLRNWVAWGMFMEGLPQGGFFVRQSAETGKSNLDLES